MGKYTGSPWGHIRGKLDDCVGGVWKGIEWVRVLVFPTQRGTLAKYRMYKDGLIPPSQFSFPQMNIRRASLQVLGYVARMNLENYINIVWKDFVDRHALLMTATNAFVKKSAANLYHSMPQFNQEYTVPANEPDLKVIKMSDGDLEPSPSIISAVYTAGTGALALSWDVLCCTNGLATDKAFVTVLKKPILESVGRDGTWAPKLYMYGPLDAGTRASGTGISIFLPGWLTATDLTVFLYFLDDLGQIGHSLSVSKAVTAP